MTRGRLPDMFYGTQEGLERGEEDTTPESTFGCHMGLMDATIHTYRRIRARQRLAKCPMCPKSANNASFGLSHLRQSVSLLDVNEAVVDPEHGQVGRGGVASAAASSSSRNRRSPLRRSWKYILTLKGHLTQSIFSPLTGIRPPRGVPAALLPRGRGRRGH